MIVHLSKIKCSIVLRLSVIVQFSQKENFEFDFHLLFIVRGKRLKDKKEKKKIMRLITNIDLIGRIEI